MQNASELALPHPPLKTKLDAIIHSRDVLLYEPRGNGGFGLCTNARVDEYITVIS